MIEFVNLISFWVGNILLSLYVTLSISFYIVFVTHSLSLAIILIWLLLKYVMIWWTKLIIDGLACWEYGNLQRHSLETKNSINWKSSERRGKHCFTHLVFNTIFELTFWNVCFYWNIFSDCLSLKRLCDIKINQPFLYFCSNIISKIITA